ncbi:ATP-binding protein [Alicyclobacillus sp. ALC3]|uniref:ATP-binding protein n=1 Tax=Alicyclobacillus sp. ALC3 TaxID=2796143 RepID=UPI0023792A89|nr:ATP-binding protein [Alicyclobacillus sp. ALC3]WDL95433.1 PAS domain S-box protein [Alicyclobacillus sp. ALC3]
MDKFRTVPLSPLNRTNLRNVLELQRTLGVYRSLVDYNPAAIYLLNLDGRIVRANQVVAQMLEYTVDELLQMHLRDVVTEQSWKDAEVWLQKCSNRRLFPDVRFYVTLRTKNGRETNFGVKAVPAYSGANLAGIFIIGRDIDVSRRTEELIMKSEKLAVIGQLAAGVAHEIRNPLTSLKGFVQLFSSTVAVPPEYASIMLSELERIESIIQEFLVFAKPQAVNYGYKHPKEMLEHVIAIVQTEATIHGVLVMARWPEELPDIWCDDNQIKQVFLNVLKNAVEAMPNGGTIDVEVTHSAVNEVLVRIRDQGVGIPPERIPKLGEPFYTTKEKGTGLGLMVSQRILEAHRATMDIQSQVGAGTTVEVRIPIKPRDVVAGMDEAAPTRSR